MSRTQPELQPSAEPRVGGGGEATESPTNATLRTELADPVRLRPEARTRPPVSKQFHLVVPAAIFLMSRIGVFVAAKATSWFEPQLSVSQVLSSWDGGWFMAIAENGYPGSLAAEGGGNRWAFSPGFPALIRFVSELTGWSSAISGIVVATLAGLAAAVVVWILVEGRLGASAATTTTLILCFYPSAYVLGMVYADSLLILFAALCLLAIERRWWLTAGVCASAAYLVRVPGLVLVLVLAIAVVRVLRERWSPRPLFGLAIAPIGFVGWTLYQWNAVGTPTAYSEAQDAWQNDFNWFSTPFRSLWQVLTNRETWSSAPRLLAATALLIVAATFVAAVRFARRNPGIVPLEWWVYSVATTLFAFSPFWPASILRYTMALFPLFAVAWGRRPRETIWPAVAVSASVMGTLALVAFVGVANWQSAPLAP